MTQIKRIESHNIFTFLYHLIVILGVYDGIRSKLIFGGPFTYLKELSVLLILLGVFRLKQNLTLKEFVSANLVMVFYLFTFGTILVALNDIPLTTLRDINRGAPGGYGLHFKTIEAFILVFILFYYERLTHNKFEVLANFFVKACFWYVLISLFLYFVVPETIIQKPWWGRISVGYPTFDTQLLCFALFITLFKPGLFKKNNLISIILIVGIIINNTGSAYAMTCIILGSYASKCIFEDVSSFKSIIVILTCLLAILGVIYLYNYASGEFGVILRLKIDHVIYKITGLQNFETNFVSEEIRDFQLERAFSIKNSFLDVLFGGYVTIAGVIESQYGFLLRAYGLVGVALYYSWLASISIYSLIRKNWLLLISVALYFTGTLAVPNTYSFGISSAFGILLFLFGKTASHENNNKPILKKDDKR